MTAATKYYTLTELMTKIQEELDLEDEDFIKPQELIGYFNEAVEEAEKVVNALQKDYFLTKSDPITITAGVDLVDLPTDIFAHKIRTISYANGERGYEMKQLKSSKKFSEYADSRFSPPAGDDDLGYDFLNTSPGVVKILLTPVPAQENGTIQIWYIRKANWLADGADVMDIPEANNYVLEYARMRCFRKEKSPLYGASVETLKALKDNLEATLADRTADPDESEMEMDLSIYGEMS